LWRTLAQLGMYTVFHSGIFYDGRRSTYCIGRPTSKLCARRRDSRATSRT
jgi:hypothetical protein